MKQPYTYMGWLLQPLLHLMDPLGRNFIDLIASVSSRYGIFSLAMTKGMLVMLLGLGSLQKAAAQDIHFSQIHASPTALNPAMTGIFDGDYRVIANYRQQWRSATANYRTLAASADVHVMGLGEHGLLSAGVNLMADRAGDLDFTTSSVMFSVGAARKLNARGDHMISVAIQSGILQQSLNYAAMHVFDPEPAMMNGAGNRVAAADISAGIAWYKSLGRDHKIYSGLSIFHIGEPDMALLGGAGAAYSEPLARRGVWHGGGEFKLKEQWYALPSFIMMEQSPNREITLGSFLRYDTDKSPSNQKGSSIYLGSWFRWFYRPDISSGYDSMVMTARWDKNRLAMAFSYDINMSSLARVTRGAGGPELSIIYIGDWSGSSQKNKVSRMRVDCPRF